MIEVWENHSATLPGTASTVPVRAWPTDCTVPGTAQSTPTYYLIIFKTITIAGAVETVFYASPRRYTYCRMPNPKE
jgi:hypothetical protein